MSSLASPLLCYYSVLDNKLSGIEGNPDTDTLSSALYFLSFGFSYGSTIFDFDWGFGYYFLYSSFILLTEGIYFGGYGFSSFGGRTLDEDGFF